MMTESRLIHEFREYFDARMDKLEVKIDARFDNFCEHCQNAPTFREKFRTLFAQVYAIWGVIGFAITTIFGVFIFILQNHIR